MLEIKTRRIRYDYINHFGGSLGVVVHKKYCKKQGSPGP